VHLPLALAFIMPALAIGFAWALWTGRARPRAWLAVVALQAVLLGAGLVAMNTGEREEDRVENVVPSNALEQHEEYAEQFVWATAGTLMIALLVVPFRRSPVARTLATLTVVGTFVVTAAALRVGHAGGRLVYVHNAGAAYSASTSAAAAAVTDGAERTRPHDDDDR
jgi:cell division protein FtsW (lipid II flippase)